MKKEVGCQFGLLSGSQGKEKYIELFCASKLYLRNCEKKSFVENDGSGSIKTLSKEFLINSCKPYMANTFSILEIVF